MLPIMDPVTTTDELIPSGETSSYRSNPLGLAEFTLSRRDPEYVGRSKKVNELEAVRKTGACPLKPDPEMEAAFNALRIYLDQPELRARETEIGSMIYAVKPGDGSAREQAASCQRVLGGLANIANEYATKRYRSNVINWGMLPFLLDEEPSFDIGDFIYVPGVRAALEGDMQHIPAYVIKNEEGNPIHEINLHIAEMTSEEKEIVKAGCLINYNRNRHSEN